MLTRKSRVFEAFFCTNFYLIWQAGPLAPYWWSPVLFELTMGCAASKAPQARSSRGAHRGGARPQGRESGGGVNDLSAAPASADALAWQNRPLTGKVPRRGVGLRQRSGISGNSTRNPLKALPDLSRCPGSRAHRRRLRPRVRAPVLHACEPPEARAARRLGQPGPRGEGAGQDRSLCPRRPRRTAAGSGGRATLVVGPVANLSLGAHPSASLTATNQVIASVLQALARLARK